MKIRHKLAVSLAALLMITQAASAQDWQQRKRDRPQQQPQQQQQVPQQAPQQRAAPGGGGGACSPSGFAGLSRNCSTNTGGCQRMPDSCNRGWCCP